MKTLNRALLGIALLCFSAATYAASLTFDNSSDSERLEIRAGQFESGFNVNGNQIQTPGLGTGSVSVRKNQGTITFDGGWIDLGQTVPYDRTIYFVDPRNPSIVREILNLSFTVGNVSGTWESSANGDLGPVPGDADPADVVLANGTLVSFSAPFLGGRASSSLGGLPVPTLGEWSIILMVLALMLLGGNALRRSGRLS